MTNRHIGALALVGVLSALVLAPLALGQPQSFRTHLSSNSEVPPVETKAQGEAIFQLNSFELRIQLTRTRRSESEGNSPPLFDSPGLSPLSLCDPSEGTK